MRKALITVLFLLGLQFVHAQYSKYDSLKNLLATAKNDSTRYKCLHELFYAYLWSYPDSSINYVQQQILLAKQMQSDFYLSWAYVNYAFFYIITGDYTQALRYDQE